ncbi:MAG TPA: hypothetical protein VFO39_00525 [Candidatus Sulfotelmatobacter sp.]|nr:hypothetical protein [Candidatus Sulfotelmatobacter sp.]
MPVQETVVPGEQSKASGALARTFGVMTLVVVVTLDFVLAIARRWSGYDWLLRLDAVVLLALMLLFPILTVVGNRRQHNRTQALRPLIPTYIMLLLAVIVFGR